MRLIADMVAFTVNEVPSWNPTNICSYHLQEAGATPVQELAYALSTAIAVLDEVKQAGQVSDDDFEKVVGRISFFVNAGVRFVEETCKMRAFVRLWEEITAERYGVRDEKMRRFRYGVQVNSLGLTEEQPENNVQRIVLEMLGVTLSRDARARSIQLPAWNEALGLPRPWDQQWSLRLQQVLANVVDNAVKYSPDGGEITVALEAREGSARLIVSDLGIGVLASQREHIFHRFFRADPQLTRGVGGTGLGLYICRELIEAMGGRIWAEPNEPRGTRIVIDLPAAPST